MIEAYFDGSCEPNNPGGIATYGYIIYDGAQIMQEGYGLACEPFSNLASNNVAEYVGLIKVLDFIVNNGLTDTKVVIRGDSQLIIQQMIGSYSVHSERLLPLHAKARGLTSQIKDIQFLWIPREQNAHADKLSHRAYEDYINDHPEEIERIRAFGYRASRLINQKLRGR